jgi:hypothetical protein
MVMPGNAPTGRQRGGTNSKKVDNEQKCARSIAIVSALSQSQHGGGFDDLSSLLEGFIKHNDDISSTRTRKSKKSRQRGPKRQKRRVPFQDDATDQNRDDGNGGEKSAMKEKSVVILKKTDSKDINLVNACLLSSLLVPEYPSLAPADGEHSPSAFDESYKTAAAVAQGIYVGDASGKGLVDPRNPWHALISRKIVDTATKRDASGISTSSTSRNDAVLKARNILLRHAQHTCSQSSAIK